MTAGLLYNTTRLTSLYLTYPVSVSVSVVTESRLQFPAVTVCNVNPVKKSAWNKFTFKTAGSASASVQGPTEPKRKRKKRDLDGE